MTQQAPSFPYFLVNPANDPIVRGEVTAAQMMRTHNRRWQIMLYGVSMLAAAFVALWWLMETVNSLETRGAMTVATVTRHAIEDQSAYDNNPTLYYLEFQFEVDGRVYTVQQNVNTGQYTSLRDGHRVRIAYLPDDPTIARIASGRSPSLITASCLTAVGIGIVMIFTLYQATQHHRYRRGQILQGQIIRAEPKMDSQRKLYVQLQYVFMTPHGQRIERSHILTGEKWTVKAPPPAGTPVFIQYANEREFQLL